MSEELRECFFCGHDEARVIVVDEVTDAGCEEATVPLYAASCWYCGARGPMALSEGEAVEAWNRRAERTVRPTLYDDFCGCVNVCCPTCGRTLSGPWSDVRDAVRSSKRRDVMGNYCSVCGARIEVCE